MVIDLFTNRKNPCRTDRKFISDFEKLSIERRNAETLYNEATGISEIEASIFKLKELEMRYSFMLRQAKLEKLYNSVSVRFTKI